MTPEFAIEEQPYTDGTSQSDRLVPALDPDYVVVDERSLRDLLAFARDYAREIRFFEVLDGELAMNGDWSGFLGDDMDLDGVVAFMQDPSSVSPAAAEKYGRPHFALFLTFLNLLQHAQRQMNGLTKRHLDFYFQEVLKMARRPGIPDKVNVLIELARRETEALLPAGTALDAGTDSAGRPLVYQTDENIVVNQAQVARLSSLYVKRQVIGVRDAHLSRQADEPQEAFMDMLRMALGDPQPSDPLPPYAPTEQSKASVDLALLLDLRALIAYVRDSQTGLSMTLSNFRRLMRTRRRLGSEQNREDWREINAILQQVGENRTEGFELAPENIRAFEANARKATGNDLTFEEDALPEVESIYDLYERQDFPDVRRYILDQMHFPTVEDFVTVMALKIGIDSDWFTVNGILLEAGRRKAQALGREWSDDDLIVYGAREDKAADAFEANLSAALGEDLFGQLADIDTIDDLYAALTYLGAYFHMSAEDFADVLMLPVADDSTVGGYRDDPAGWQAIYDLLARVYREKVYAVRRTRLAEIREANQDDLPGVFEKMLAVAGQDFSLDRLQTNLSQADFQELQQAERNLKAQPPQTPDDWERVYQLLERGLRPHLSVPVAEKTRWRNAYMAEDATVVRVDNALPGAADQQHWETFGREPADAGAQPPSSEIGWAISSPLLDLSGGERTITLVLGFQNDEAIDWEAIRELLPSRQAEDGAVVTASHPFEIAVSSENGWLTGTSQVALVEDYFAAAGMQQPGVDDVLPGLRFDLTLGVDVEPLQPLPDDMTLAATHWPLLKIVLRHLLEKDRGEYMTAYQPLQNLRLVRAHLQVAVDHLPLTHLRNESGNLDPQKPFEPFGSQAVAGSRFYLGHPELVHKQLDALHFRYDWKGLPENWSQGDYYKNYPGNPSLFFVDLEIVENRKVMSLGDDHNLFTQTGAAGSAHYSLEVGEGLLPIGANPTGPVVTLPDPGDNLLDWPRYVRWTLQPPGFMHDAYPRVAAQKALELAADIANDKDIVASNYKVNPPYTPEMQWLTVGYTAKAEIVVSGSDWQHAGHTIFHLHPCGYSEIIPAPDSDLPTVSFLPAFDYAGELYIGIANLRLPQNLSLLFQVAEGTADPDLPRQALAWSYLSGNQWLTLEEGALLGDDTRGLINSGIVKLALEPIEPNTLLDPDLYWLRLAIPRYTESVCDIVAIHAQAVSATFADQNNASDHLSQPLPAETITGMASPLSHFAGVRQPYTSYGGKMAEQELLFYTRISERLRHKGRAQNPWDYEHLILNRFPEVYKAKCLPPNRDRLGEVRIVVIPDIRNKLPANPFAPKASADLITSIEAYLQDRTPAVVTVKVQNARYRPVKVRLGVRFRDGYAPGFFRQQLNDDLNRFLSPWAFGETTDVTIGGRIYANTLINFVDEREYIDYVAQITLFTIDETGRNQLIGQVGGDGYWVETAAPDEVLVAHPRHEIDLIRDDIFVEEQFTGINYMRIELDFTVG